MSNENNAGTFAGYDTGKTNMASSFREHADAFQQNEEAVTSLNESTQQLVETREIVDDIKKTIENFSNDFLSYLAAMEKTTEDIKTAAQMTIPKETEQEFRKMVYDTCYKTIIQGMRGEANVITKDIVREFTTETQRQIHRLKSSANRWSVTSDIGIFIVLTLFSLSFSLGATLIMNITTFHNQVLWCILGLAASFMAISGLIVWAIHDNESSKVETQETKK